MNSRPQLLCLPPAGAGPSLYRSWKGRHGDRVDIHPVSLPGREARFVEPMPESIAHLADILADELQDRLAERYAIFGYSMGALLAYEILRRWSGRGIRPPEAVFVLAAGAPDRFLVGMDPIHELSDEDFVAALIGIGGMPAEILDNPEAMAFFTPVIRNDFRLCETYLHDGGEAPISSSAHAFVATGDTLVPAETSAAWENFFSGDFRQHVIDGKHMLDKEPFDGLLDRILSLWSDVRQLERAPT